MKAQMKPHNFEPFHPISIIGFLSNFKLACDTSGIHILAPIRLFLFFLKKSAFSTQHAWLAPQQDESNFHSADHHMYNVLAGFELLAENLCKR